MPSPDLDLDVSPIPRSREENQERAFIAASRRKDRSLDARLESANRASMLHKKRTGKSLQITKDIVEKEAMYEEVDERHQEKRIRMLQAQNMQIEEQLNRQLLTALAVRANQNHRGLTSSASSATTNSVASAASPKAVASHQHFKRAASMTPRDSMDGVRKMSMDLSRVRSSVSEGMQTGALNSPMVMENGGYTMSPPGYDAMASPQNSQEWYSQVPAYVQPGPWPQQWGGFQQPQQEPQQHVMQDYISQMPMNVAGTRPFRDRLASAPEIPVHGMSTDSFSMMSPAPAPAPSPVSQPQHSRVQSEPDMSMVMMMRNLQQQQAQQPMSKPASPKTQATSDAYSSPSTPPQSPRTTGVGTVGVPQIASNVETLGKNDEGMLFTQDALDPDFDEFSQFALGLGSTTELAEREPFGFDDFVTLDDFTAAA